MDNIEIKYKTNFFSREKSILLTDEALGLYRRDILLMQIEKEEIKDIRYGVASIRGLDFYKAFTYLTDWNAPLVYSISRQILKNKGLFNVQK